MCESAATDAANRTESAGPTIPIINAPGEMLLERSSIDGDVPERRDPSFQQVPTVEDLLEQVEREVRVRDRRLEPQPGVGTLRHVQAAGEHDLVGDDRRQRV